jgi:DNA-binding transcriptional MerR regulator
MVGPRLRIGEMSRRLGVSPEALRAWEMRYQVVRPERTQGGLRLYSEYDEQRLRTVIEHIAAGLSASEAARLTMLADDGPSDADRTSIASMSSSLEDSLYALDERLAQASLDRIFATLAIDSALSQVILPFLRGLGERWASGETSVAHEHFASNVIGGRLRSLARGWQSGLGPRALLSCAPGEQHDLGLLSFGLVLRGRGWRISYLGADTPLSALSVAAAALSPAIVVLSATKPRRILAPGPAIMDLARFVRVGIGGAGATKAVAEALELELLGEDVVEAAALLQP